MALGPKQMQESIIRNLKDKTGKDLSEWISILEAKGIQDKKEAMAHLKSEYKLGHFQAKIICEQAQGIDQYKDAVSFADQIFHTQGTKSLFHFVKEKILLLGGDVREQPCQTYIPYYRKNQFSLITQKKEGVILGLNLPDNFIANGIEPAKNLGSERINGQVFIGSKEDWNPLIAAALEVAYKNN